MADFDYDLRQQSVDFQIDLINNQSSVLIISVQIMINLQKNSKIKNVQLKLLKSVRMEKTRERLTLKILKIKNSRLSY